MEKSSLMPNKICFCDTGLAFELCCGRYLQNQQKAPSALALMRSRYSAFASHNADYLMQTTAVSQRSFYTKDAILKWAKENTWQRLEVLNYTQNTVEFKAYFIDSSGQEQVHYEFSTFELDKDAWFYLDGKFE